MHTCLSSVLFLLDRIPQPQISVFGYETLGKETLKM